MTVDNIPVSRVEWKGAVRIIRSAFPPIDLFEDIADPADWPLLISAEQKSNPRVTASVGNLDLVSIERRVGGHGASYLMAPFTPICTTCEALVSGAIRPLLRTITRHRKSWESGSRAVARMA